MSLVMRKPAFCICENKAADKLRSMRSYLTFQASSHLQWLYSPVCVGPGWKPRRPVFSQRGSYCLSDPDFFLIPQRGELIIHLLYSKNDLGFGLFTLALHMFIEGNVLSIDMSVRMTTSLPLL